jgi:hypothetical protein
MSRPTGTQWLEAIAHETARQVRCVLPFHAAVAVHTLLVIAVHAISGSATGYAHMHYVGQFAMLYLVIMPVVLASLAAIRLLLTVPDWTGRAARVRAFLSPAVFGRWLSGLLLIVSLTVFMGSFTTFKTMMPELMGGFPHDRVQADLDRVLHFGIDPGPYLATLPWAAALRGVVEWNYSVLWFAAGFLPLFLIAMSARADAVRLRYFLMFFAVWTLVGNALALVFLSAGPAFYAEVTGDAARFAGQMDFLRADAGDGPSVAAFQAYLWTSYETGTAGIGTGISAFPSVHVALTMMNALFLFDASRRAGIAGLLYVAFITMSSVFLAWHYAIDGYVSIVVVTALHLAMKRLLARREAPAPVTSRSSPARA